MTEVLFFFKPKKKKIIKIKQCVEVPLHERKKEKKNNTCYND